MIPEVEIIHSQGPIERRPRRKSLRSPAPLRHSPVESIMIIPALASAGSALTYGREGIKGRRGCLVSLKCVHSSSLERSRRQTCGAAVRLRAHTSCPPLLRSIMAPCLASPPEGAPLASASPRCFADEWHRTGTFSSWRGRGATEEPRKHRVHVGVNFLFGCVNVVGHLG